MLALRLCFISICFSAFIAVPTNTENSKFFLMLVYELFLASYNFIAIHTQQKTIVTCSFRQHKSMAVIWWLDYVKCTCNLFVFLFH